MDSSSAKEAMTAYLRMIKDSEKKDIKDILNYKMHAHEVRDAPRTTKTPGSCLVFMPTQWGVLLSWRLQDGQTWGNSS